MSELVYFSIGVDIENSGLIQARSLSCHNSKTDEEGAKMAIEYFMRDSDCRWIGQRIDSIHRCEVNGRVIREIDPEPFQYLIAPKHPLKSGMSVVHKAFGKPVMVVTEYRARDYADDVTCGWFDKLGQWHENIFDANMIEEYVPVKVSSTNMNK